MLAALCVLSTAAVGLEIPLPGGSVTLESLYCGAMHLRTEWSDPDGLLADWTSTLYLVTAEGARIPYRARYGETIEFAPFNLGLGYLPPAGLAAVEIAGQSYPLPAAG